MDLSLAQQVDWGIRTVPQRRRVGFLARAEELARETNDLEMLAAIAQWRLREQMKEQPL